MFDEKNKIVGAFRMARDHFEQSQILPVRLRLLERCNGDSLQYSMPTAFKIAVLIVGD